MWIYGDERQGKGEYHSEKSNINARAICFLLSRENERVGVTSWASAFLFSVKYVT